VQLTCYCRCLRASSPLPFGTSSISGMRCWRPRCAVEGQLQLTSTFSSKMHILFSRINALCLLASHNAVVDFRHTAQSHVRMTAHQPYGNATNCSSISVCFIQNTMHVCSHPSDTASITNRARLACRFPKETVPSQYVLPITLFFRALWHPIQMALKEADVGTVSSLIASYCF
jgi:hypothetical protein